MSIDVLNSVFKFSIFVQVHQSALVPYASPASVTPTCHIQPFTLVWPFCPVYKVLKNLPTAAHHPLPPKLCWLSVWSSFQSLWLYCLLPVFLIGFHLFKLLKAQGSVNIVLTAEETLDCSEEPNILIKVKRHHSWWAILLSTLFLTSEGEMDC